MIRFLFSMIIPLWVCVYTIQFGRWLSKKHIGGGSAISAFFIAGLSLIVSGIVLWRIYR